jgi:acetyl esterase/lipase
MNTILVIIQFVAATIGSLVAILSLLLFIKLRWPAAALWFMKLYASALSRVLTLVGLLCMVVGLTTGSAFIGVIGTYAFLIFLSHVINVTRAPSASSSFVEAFGMEWEKKIKPEQKKHFLQAHTIVKLPTVPDSVIERDIPFATIPYTDRKLLCDVWQPPLTVSPSGLAFIYLHGSAWYLLDKDLGTRPFFRHLAAQGHVIMDVAYRLSPETDMMGMIHDVKRAIVWMREHEHAYGVRSNQIVVGGGSAGAHLALMAAYTALDPQFTPNELEGKDISASAVVSFYGPSDLEAMYYHTSQHLTTRATPGKPKKPVPTQMPSWMIKAVGDDYHRLGFDKGFEHAGAIANLLGGHPDECPETYARYSPLMHVHPHCPPTLLIHGAHDIMAPVTSTHDLYDRLEKEKVPAVLHILPQTDHAFDLQLPKLSPSVHNAWYDVERFLALHANSEKHSHHIKWKEELHVHDEY